MAMRSAMRRFLPREAEGHRENGAAAGSGTERRDLAAHSPGELSRDRQAQSRAVRHAIATATIVDIEQFLGGLRRESASLVGDLEMPVVGADGGRKLHLAAAVL